MATCNLSDLINAACQNGFSCLIEDKSYRALILQLLCNISQNGQSGSGVPSGVILMWSGSIATIPSGWNICDGNNGTPDLRDKFVVGAKQDDSGTAKTNLTGSLTQSGGSITHNHGITDPGHFHVYAGVTGAGPGIDAVADAAPSDHVSTMPTGITINNQSAPQPYYALAYIMKA